MDSRRERERERKRERERERKYYLNYELCPVQ